MRTYSGTAYEYDTGKGYYNIINLTNSIPAGHRIYLKLIASNLSSSIEKIDLVYKGVSTTLSQNALTSHNIGTTVSSSNYFVRIYTVNEFEYSLNIDSVQVIDLTLMFGSEIANSMTITQFESMFPSDYYPYNAGQLISLNPTEVVSTGFNLWDEEVQDGAWYTMNGEYNSNAQQYTSCKNKIHVIPGLTYYIHFGTTPQQTYVFWFDENDVYITYQSPITNKTIISPNNAAYAGISWTKEGYGSVYKNDICFSISDVNKNGIYTPYTTNTLDLSWIQSLTYTPEGETTPVQLFPNGLCSAGTVYDEVTPTKAIKRVGSVDLGTLTWDVFSTVGYRTSFNNGNNADVSVICNKFTGIAFNDRSFSIKNTIWCNGSENSMAVTADQSLYANADAFKNAVSGVMLYYVLETPIEVPINHTIEYAVQPGGTEQLLPENQPNTLPVTSEIKMDVTYPLNAVGTIQNLPYNYMNERTLDSLISALNTAVTGYTFSKTTTNGYLQITTTATPTT